MMMFLENLGTMIGSHWRESLLSSTLVCAFILTLVTWKSRWNSSIRYALLLIALIKFVIPVDWSLALGPAPSERPTSLPHTPSTDQTPHEPTVSNFERTPARSPSQSSTSIPDVEASQEPSRLLKDSETTTDPSHGLPSLVMVPSAFPEPALQPRSPKSSRSGATPLIGIASLSISLLLGIMATVRTRVRIGRWTSSSQLDVALARAAHQVGLRRAPKLRILYRPSLGPMASGVWSGVIWMPQSLIGQLNKSELHMVLIHECLHLKRRDPLVEWFQLIVRCLWWFHPAVWILDRRLRTVREECCDEHLVADHLVHPAEYCRAILTTAQRLLSPEPSLPVAEFSSVHTLERRFRRLFDPEWNPKKGMKMHHRIAVLLGLCLSTFILPGVGRAGTEEEPVSSGSQVAQEDRTKLASTAPLSSIVSTKEPIQETSPPETKTLQQTIRDLQVLAQILTDRVAEMEHRDLRQADRVSALEARLRALSSGEVDESALGRHRALALADSLGALFNQSTSYVIVGSIGESGFQIGDSGLTLFEAVANAKPTQRADLSKVLLVRPHAKSPLQIEFDYEEMQKSGNSSTNILITNGDTIYVPTRTAPIIAGHNLDRILERSTIHKNLMSKDPALRWKAVDALAADPPADTLLVLYPHLVDPDVFVRVRAIRAMEESGSKRALGLLKSLQGESEPLVRDAIDQAIRNLSKTQKPEAKDR